MKIQIFILSIAVMVCQWQDGTDAQPTCAKALLEPVPIKEELKDGLQYKDGNAIMCSDGKCDKISLDNIKDAYADVFSSKEDAEETTNLRYNNYVKEISSACAATKPAAESPVRVATSFITPVCQQFWSYRFWSDRDKCCPTWRYVTFTRGPLTNVYGWRCYILQIPYLRLYQYISVGICGWPRNCNTCRQQRTVQSMLAWCPGHPGLKIHHFSIPTYCSCQG